MSNWRAARRAPSSLPKQTRMAAGSRRKVWGEHPYGRSRFGTSEDLQSIDASAVEQWRKEHMGALHPLILVRGDIVGSSFLQSLVTTLSDQRLKNPEITPSETVSAGARQVQQEGADIAFLGPAAGTRDERILGVVECILGGPGGRLADEMWRQRGLAFPEKFRHQPRLQVRQLS